MSNEAAPAYVMVQIKIKDFGDLMQRYGGPVFPVLEKFDGQMIAGSNVPKLLEGSWDGNRAAVLRFLNMERAESWYNSPEYRPLKDLRIDQLTESGQVILVAGFDPTALGR